MVQQQAGELSIDYSPVFEPRLWHTTLYTICIVWSFWYEAYHMLHMICLWWGMTELCFCFRSVVNQLNKIKNVLFGKNKGWVSESKGVVLSFDPDKKMTSSQKYSKNNLLIHCWNYLIIAVLWVVATYIRGIEIICSIIC